LLSCKSCHVCAPNGNDDALGLVLILTLTWGLFNMDDYDLHIAFSLCGMSGSLFGKLICGTGIERVHVLLFIIVCLFGVLFALFF
jgi:hypothetical protein